MSEGVLEIAQKCVFGYFDPEDEDAVMVRGQLAEIIQPFVDKETAGLREWKQSILSKVQYAIPEWTTGEWGGDKTGWGFVSEIIGFAQRDREALRTDRDALREQVRVLLAERKAWAAYRYDLQTSDPELTARLRAKAEEATRPADKALTATEKKL